MKAPQKSLKAWGDQKWTTKSGKKSSETGERYLPEKAIKALSPAEYAATTKAKRAGKAAGMTVVLVPLDGAPSSAGAEEYADVILTSLDQLPLAAGGA